MSEQLVSVLKHSSQDIFCHRHHLQMLCKEAADHIEELSNAVLDAASAYLEEQYGYTMLSNPIDRARIMEKLK